MAQMIYCDQCDEGRPAFIVVSFYNTPVTEAVCLACLPQWIVDLTGAIKGNLGEEVADQMVRAINATHFAPESAGEAPETPSPAPKPAAAFPGTANVRKSTHGHRATKRGPIEEPPEEGQIVG